MGDEPSCSRLLEPAIIYGHGPVNGIFDLPDLVVDKIFSNLSYDEMAKSRLVNHDFNDYIKNEMTKGFEKLGKIISNCKNEVKKELPKRESERRKHRLTRISEIYAALDTRYSLLDLTYKKYLRHTHPRVNICFIPGKVLDEFNRVLNILRRCRECGGEFTGDTTELLKEMRDLSSMAMEHYDETILPILDARAEAEEIGCITFDTLADPAIKRRRVGRYCRDNHGLQGMPNFDMLRQVVNNSPAARDYPKTMQDKIDEMQKKIETQQHEIRALTEGMTAITSWFRVAFPEHRSHLRRFMNKFPTFKEPLSPSSSDEPSCSPRPKSRRKRNHKNISKDT